MNPQDTIDRAHDPGCSEADACLDALVDPRARGLDPVTAARVQGHLDSCPFCARAAAALAGLLFTARALPRASAPARDHWPAITARLRPRGVRRAPRLGMFAAAAGLVLALGALGARSSIGHRSGAGGHGGWAGLAASGGSFALAGAVDHDDALGGAGGRPRSVSGLGGAAGAAP